MIKNKKGNKYLTFEQEKRKKNPQTFHRGKNDFPLMVKKNCVSLKLTYM